MVFVTGCEPSLFASGFLPGADAYRRMATLMSGDPTVYATLGDVESAVNAFLGKNAARVRAVFEARSRTRPGRSAGSPGVRLHAPRS